MKGGDSSDLDPRRILVVDDDPIIAHLVVLLLKRSGFEAASTDRAEDALALIRTFRPDLIITDLGMPGIDGVELCSIVKGSPETSSIPVVFLSGQVAEDHISGESGSGAAAFLSKPLLDVRVIRTVLSHSGAGSATLDQGNRTALSDSPLPP